MNMTKKIGCLLMSATFIVGLAGCGAKNANAAHEITSVNGCVFNVPKEFYENSIDYSDMMLDSLVGDGSEIEKNKCSKLEYSNLFSMSDFNDYFSISVYDIPEAMDLKAIVGDTVKETLFHAMDLMTVPIPGTNETWGVDLTSPFYQGVTFDDSQLKFSEEDGVQRMTIPFESEVLVEPMESDEEQNPDAQSALFQYRGYFSLIANGEETRMMVLHCLKNEKIDLEGYANSLQFADNPGNGIVFDAAELDRMNQALMEAIQDSLAEDGFLLDGDENEQE